ncbi:MAG: hypothetical protein ACO34J_08545, partial [Prochlorothrix sp.]
PPLDHRPPRLPTPTRSLFWPLLGLLWGMVLGPIEPAFGHGARIDYTIQPQINLVARYDSGEPMATAEVTIYSPANPTEPWQTLTTDPEGQFNFTPDPSQPGEWAVKVRSAGHGSVITLNLGSSAGNTADSGPSGSAGADSPLVFASSAPLSSPRLSFIQQSVLVGSVIWGFVGTGFYFARKS